MLTITFKKIGKFIKFILSGSLTEISFEGDKENEKKEVKGMKKTAPPQQQKLESTIKNIFGMATTAVIAASLYYHIIWKHKKKEAEEL